uniref:(northern house mosquito) hypothetical protein n=1 Tax=Culex pipiens TaxID=7175 RepID=A0A8D8GSD4_CULPI
MVDNGRCGVARRSTRRRRPTKSELVLRGSGRHGSREPDEASPDRATAGKSKSGRTGSSNQDRVRNLPFTWFVVFEGQSWSYCIPPGRERTTGTLESAEREKGCGESAEQKTDYSSAYR